MYQFVLICQRDVALLIADIIDSKDRARTQLYVRVLALVLSEFFEDLEVLFNNEFRKQFESLFPREDVRSGLRDVCRTLSQLRQCHDPTLRAIRNTVIAHREHDVTAQLAALASLDQGRILDLAMAVKMWQASFVLLWIPVLQARSRFNWSKSLRNTLVESLGLPPNSAAAGDVKKHGA